MTSCWQPVGPPHPIRILVTGSREWTDSQAIAKAIHRAIAEIPCPDGVNVVAVTIVHGAQGTRDKFGRVVKGLDLLADQFARSLDLDVDPHPADWSTCDPSCPSGHRKMRWDGTDYCPTAGFRRNAEMVASGADICLGFPIGKSSGTRDCMRAAARAGIRVVNVPQEWMCDVA